MVSFTKELKFLEERPAPQRGIADKVSCGSCGRGYA